MPNAEEEKDPFRLLIYRSPAALRVNPSGFAVKTLKLVGVLNLFEIFETDDQAVESFR